MNHTRGSCCVQSIDRGVESVACSANRRSCGKRRSAAVSNDIDSEVTTIKNRSDSRCDIDRVDGRVGRHDAAQSHVADAVDIDESAASIQNRRIGRSVIGHRNDASPGRASVDFNFARRCGDVTGNGKRYIVTH